MSQARSWVFTVNNFTDDDVDIVKNLPVLRIICGREVGENGTPHLQGAVSFSKPKRLAAMKKLLPRAHLEVMRGKWSDQDYCAKDGDLVRCEDNSSQGERTDLKKVVGAIAGGMSKAKLWEEHPGAMARYRHMFDDYHAAKEAPGFRKVLVKVYWGEGGTGKSREAMYIKNEDGDLVPRTDQFVVPDSANLKWWDGYNGQKCIVLDDFRGATCMFKRWLRICDGHPFTIEIKGGIRHALWDEVIITSNPSPDDWWDGIDMSVIQFRRRLNKIYEMKHDGQGGVDKVCRWEQTWGQLDGEDPSA